MRYTSSLLVMLLVLFACSPVDSDGDGADDAIGDDAGTADDEDDADDPGDADEPDYLTGGEVVGTTEIVEGAYDPDTTFIWGYTVEASSMDPHVGTTGFDQNWLFPAYDRLVYSAPSGELQPMLAESWEIADDNSSITFNLREGVTFHDGEPFNAEAVKLSLERARDLEESQVSGLLESIQSIDTPDDLTVVLNIAGATAPLLPSLSDRAGMIISPAAFDNEDLDRFPVGTGPYQVVDYRAADRVTYEAFADYWDPEVQRTAGVEFRILPDDETRINAIRAGEVHVGIVRESQIPVVLEDGLNVLDGPRPSFYSFELNASVEPFDDPLVRRAIRHAINREIIGNEVFEGWCQPTSQPWPENSPAFNPDLGHGLEEGGFAEFNPDLARELLEEAGLGDGFEFEAIVANITGYGTATEVIQAQLADIGVTMGIRQVEAAQVNQLWGIEEQSAASFSSYAPTPDDSGPLFAHYNEGAIGNPGNLTTERYQELSTEVQETLDPDARAAVFHDIMEELVEMDMHTLPVCMRGRQEVFVPGVMGLDIYANGARDYRGVAVANEIAN